MTPARPLAAVILAGLLVGAGQAQEPSRPPDKADKPEKPLTFSADVEMVVVDVVVTAARGGPLSGLRPEDFVVTEDGVRQEIRTFDTVEVSAGAETEEEIGAPAQAPRVSLHTGVQAMNARSLVLVFDQDHLTPVGAAKAKVAIGQFMKFGPRDGDTVMIVGTGGGNWWITRAGEARAELDTLLKGLQGRYTGHDTPDRITDWEAMRIWEDKDPVV